MELTALKCPSCGAALEAGDLDFARSLATCHHCKSLISLWRPGAPDTPPPQPRSPVQLPKKFKSSASAASLRIEWRWWTPGYIVVIGFCLIWNLFLGFFFYSITFTGKASIFAFLAARSPGSLEAHAASAISAPPSTSLRDKSIDLLLFS